MSPPAAAPPTDAQQNSAQQEVDTSAFKFTAADLDRALGFACTRSHVDKPEGVHLDSTDVYYSTGRDLGVEQEHLGASLHSVALEQMQGVKLGDTGRGAAGELFRVHTVDSIPLPDLTPKKQKRRAAILAVVAFVLMALGIIFFVLYVDSVDEKKAERARLKAEAAAQAAKPLPKPKGTIDVEAFGESVKPLKGKVMACCSSELKDAITDDLKFSLTALIGLNGKASKLQFRKDDPSNEIIRGCIEKEVGAHSFEPAKMEPVEMGFSMVFEAPKKGKGGKKKHKKKRRKKKR